MIIRKYCAMLSCFSRVQPFGTLWTVGYQAPLSMGFSRQEYWSGLQCPPPWDLHNSGIEPVSLMSPALTDRFFTIIVIWGAPISPISIPNSSISESTLTSLDAYCAYHLSPQWH